MSNLIAFYRNQGPDASGRFLYQIHLWPDHLLESVHDYIQWLFPLREGSAFNPDAPVLTDEDIECFRKDPALREALIRSFRRMLDFYGFKLGSREEGKPLVGRAGPWPVQSRRWLTEGNHNFMRITRMLTSLSILGLPEHARAFLGALEDVHRNEAGAIIGERSVGFWRAAVL